MVKWQIHSFIQMVRVLIPLKLATVDTVAGTPGTVSIAFFNLDDFR